MNSTNPDENPNEETNDVSAILSSSRGKPTGFGQRHIFALMSFFGFANIYAMRVNLSVAIVDMTNSTSKMIEETDASNGNLSSSIPFLPMNVRDINSQKFDWDENEKALVLGSFFYGYVFTQIPGGYLAEKFGGKFLFGFGTLMTALFTLLTPLAASFGIGVLVALRILEGLAEGITFPVMHAMISKWTHTDERSVMGTFIWTGGSFGTVISMPISAILSSNFGWPWAFYSFGLIGIIWFIFWVYLITNSPESHPRIKEEELNYLTSQGDHISVGYLSRNPPIKSIFTSLPFLAIMLAHFGQNWGNYTFLTELPTYLSKIHHIDFKQNGFLSALPYIASCILSLVFSFLADYLMNSNKLNTEKTRKLMNSIGCFGAAASLLALSFANSDPNLAIACMSLAIGLSGACFSGYQMNIVDLAPNYAGTLMGISNTVANCAGFLAPAFVGAITKDNQTLAAWRTIFLSNMGVYLVVNTIYLIFAKGDIQPWN